MMVKIQKRNPAFDNLLNWVIIGFGIAVLIAVVSLLVSTMIGPSTKKADKVSEVPSTSSTGSTPIANSTAVSSDGDGNSSECLSDSINKKLIELVRSKIGLDSELAAARADVIASGETRISCVAKMVATQFILQNKCAVAVVKKLEELQKLYPELTENKEFMNGYALAGNFINFTRREASVFPAYFIDRGPKDTIILRGFYNDQAFASGLYRITSPKEDDDKSADINELERRIAAFDQCNAASISSEKELIELTTLIGGRYDEWFTLR